MPRRPLNIRDPKTWPDRPYLSVRRRGGGERATLVAPHTGQPRIVVLVTIERAIAFNGDADALAAVTPKLNYLNTGDVLEDFELDD